MTATEYVVLVDESDQEIGTAEKILAHQQSLLHRAFSAFVFRTNPLSNQTELLLQQRALHKYHSPGLWTNTCCSHPRPGEDVVAAGQRRLQEEMGIHVVLKDVGSFQYIAHFSNGLVEHELDHVLVGWVLDTVDIHSNQNEVHAWQWIEIDMLRQQIENSPAQFSAWIKRGLSLALI